MKIGILHSYFIKLGYTGLYITRTSFHDVSFYLQWRENPECCLGKV